MALSPIPRRFGGVGAVSAFAGSGLAFKVEIALGIGTDGAGIWGPDPNEGEWDLSTWTDTEGPGTLHWVDVTSRALSVTASRGRDRFESRFRTGAAIFVLDNDDGVFSPDHGSIGDVRFRPGRWIRLSGQLAGTTQEPGVFDFPSPGVDADHLVASGYDLANLGAGFKITGTVTIADAAPAGIGRILNAWVGTATNRVFRIQQLAGSALLGFAVQDPIAGVANVNSAGGALPVNTPLEIECEWIPGQAPTIIVDGVLATSGIVANTLETTTQPLMAGTESNGSGGAFGGTITDLLITPIAGDPIRINGFDLSAGGPLDGVVWEDPFGNSWEGAGLVELVGFVPAPVFTPLWTGYIAAIADEYGPAGGSIRSRISASDPLGNLQIDNPPALSSPVPAELSSDRVDRILDLAGWPEAARVSDVGFFDVQSSDLAQSRLEEIQLTAESEGGAFYATKDGLTRFRNRDYLESERSADPQFSIGAVGAGVQVLSTKSDWSTQRVYNDVTFARSGGSAQRVQDGTSIEMYQRRTNGRNNLQNVNDADVLFLATRFLGLFRYDKLRIEQLTVTAVDDSGAVDLLGLELADRVQVTIRNLQGWAFTLDTWINRITWRISADDWEADLVVDNVDSSDPIDRSGFTVDGFDDGFGV